MLLNLVGVVRPLGEYWALGLPTLEIVGKGLVGFGVDRLFGRGELPLKTDSVGEDICIALISDGVRKGFRFSRTVATKCGSISYWVKPEIPETPDIILSEF